MKATLLVLVSIVLLIGLMFGLTYLDLVHFSFFEPKYEDARRTAFEKTRSYNQSKMQDLAKYRLEWTRAESQEEKDALASVIRHRFADYDAAQLPTELAEFLKEIREY